MSSENRKQAIGQKLKALAVEMRQVHAVEAREGRSGFGTLENNGRIALTVVEGQTNVTINASE